MPQRPPIAPPGPDEKLAYAGLAYELFKVSVILVVVAVFSVTVIQTLRLPASSVVPLWLQNIYYAANTAVALVAIAALFYAKKQAEAALRQAEISGNASKAEVYQALFQDFISPIFQDGAEEAKRLFLLHEARLRAGLTTQTLGAFCAEQITAMESGDFQRFRKLANFLTFL